ncbi:MAG: hypothetical protein U0Q03_11960 [Acidimicrobiales bacterium]
MPGNLDRWTSAVERHFGFLKAHGFTLGSAEEPTQWERAVLCKAPAVAVRVARSVEFARAEVNLIRLVDDQVPPYPIWITDDVVNWTLLDTVIEARRPDLMKQLPPGGLDESELDRQLAAWAELLRLVAADFLDGDAGAIDDAAEVLRQRVQEHPQRVTVWVPREAEPSIADDVRASVPSNVEVNVAGYSRWRRKRPR